MLRISAVLKMHAAILRIRPSGNGPTVLKIAAPAILKLKYLVSERSVLGLHGPFQNGRPDSENRYSFSKWPARSENWTAILM